MLNAKSDMINFLSGFSSVVERQSSKLDTRVRFPDTAPFLHEVFPPRSSKPLTLNSGVDVEGFNSSTS